eukprot:m.48497 g.48497  ORF g.48497 m.48497 type:complete len:1661 (+) comp11045_c2_seq1:99-5081(+)
MAFGGAFNGKPESWLRARMEHEEEEDEEELNPDGVFEDDDSESSDDAYPEVTASQEGNQAQSPAPGEPSPVSDTSGSDIDAPSSPSSKGKASGEDEEEDASAGSTYAPDSDEESEASNDFDPDVDMTAELLGKQPRRARTARSHTLAPPVEETIAPSGPRRVTDLDDEDDDIDSARQERADDSDEDEFVPDDSDLDSDYSDDDPELKPRLLQRPTKTGATRKSQAQAGHGNGSPGFYVSDGSFPSSDGGASDSDGSDEEWTPGAESSKKQKKKKKPKAKGRTKKPQGQTKPTRSSAVSKQTGNDSDEFEAWEQRYGGAADDSDTAGYAMRTSERRRATKVNYREDQNEDEFGLDSDSAAARELQEQQAEAEAADLRLQVESVVTSMTREELAAEMAQMYELKQQTLALTGQERDNLQQTIDESIVCVLLTTEADITAIREGGSSSDVLYCIKWKNSAHIHNTWHTEPELEGYDVKGKRVLANYIAKQAAHSKWAATAQEEKVEASNIERAMALDALAAHKVIERIVATKEEDAIDPETGETKEAIWYLCLWLNLGYSACTWELATVILPRFQNVVDEFYVREAATTLPKRTWKVKEFQAMPTQPDWLDPQHQGLSLREYQLQGLNWLARAFCKKSSVILADEMGLGKTIQSMAFLSYLFHVQKVYGPFLIVVPLSTMMAWGREANKWAPMMNTIVCHGDKHSIDMIREHEWYNSDDQLKFNVMITTYERVSRDLEHLQTIRWAALLVDEAHRLKNHNSRLHIDLSSLDHSFRVLITGTPLQNDLKELWALLSFIMPQKFPSLPDFIERYGGLDNGKFGGDHEALQRLHGDLKPFLLRRVKRDVLKSLPPKTEQILRVDLSERQKKVYCLLLQRNYLALRDLRKGQRQSLVNILMELKKCANHAGLIDSELWNDETTTAENVHRLLKGSGKLMLLDKLLTRFKSAGHRVLIFSQMVKMLDILAMFLTGRGHRFQRLDGNVSQQRRKQAIDHFNAADSEDFCFLLSTRAGGLGVNLATADTVVIFDSDWNPQNDLQAQARAHRIGQKKHVHIYRLVSKSTVEEDILERAKQKMVLDHLVIQMASHKSQQAPNTAELDAILKFGAEELFKDSSEEGTDQKLEQMDLDSMLQHAETHDANDTGEASDSFLAAFKTVDIVTDEAEVDEEARKEKAAAAAKAIKSWEAIIPEDIRRRAIELEEQRKAEQLYLKPRQRKKPMHLQDSTNGEGAAETSSQPVAEIQDLGLGDFAAEELRALIRAIRKYGDVGEMYPQIRVAANMQDRDDEEVKSVALWLEDECAQRVSEAASIKDAKKRKEILSWAIGGIVINTQDFLVRVHGLRILAKRISKATGEFRSRTKLRLPKWDVPWTRSQDDRLLIGVHLHGVGSWGAIRADPMSKLEESMPLPETKQKPQESHLRSRVDGLLRDLIQQEESRSKKPKLISSLSKVEVSPTKASATSRSTRTRKKTKAAQTSKATKQKSTSTPDEQRARRSRAQPSSRKRAVARENEKGVVDPELDVSQAVAVGDGDEDFEPQGVTQAIIKRLLKPVGAALSIILDPDVPSKRKQQNVLLVGHHIKQLQQQNSNVFDPCELREQLWLYAANESCDMTDDAVERAIQLRKVFKLYSKSAETKTKAGKRKPSSGKGATKRSKRASGRSPKGAL